jgi:hypothetical protein
VFIGRSRWAPLFFQEGLEDGFESGGLAHEAEVVRVGTIGRTFGVVAEEGIAFEVVEAGDTLLLEGVVALF